MEFFACLIAEDIHFPWEKPGGFWENLVVFAVNTWEKYIQQICWWRNVLAFHASFTFQLCYTNGQNSKWRSQFRSYPLHYAKVILNIFDRAQPRQKGSSPKFIYSMSVSQLWWKPFKQSFNGFLHSKLGGKRSSAMSPIRYRLRAEVSGRENVG